MKKCSSCGFIVNDDVANFCPECGNPLIPVNSSDSTPAVDPEPIVDTSLFENDNPAGDQASENTEASEKPTPEDLGIVYTYIPEAPEPSAPVESNASAGDMVEIEAPEAPSITPSVDLGFIPKTPASFEQTAISEAAAQETPSAYVQTTAPSQQMSPAYGQPTTPGQLSPSTYGQPSTPVSQTSPANGQPAADSSNGQPAAFNPDNNVVNIGPAPVAPDTPPYTGPQPVVDTKPSQPGQLSRSAIIEILDRNTDMSAKVLGSGWFVIAMLGFIISTCAKLVSSVVSYLSPVKLEEYKWLVDAFNEVGVDFADFVDAVNKTRVETMIVSLVCCIPLVISCIGMIRMFIARKERPVPGGGITMAKTNLVFMLIIVSLAAIFSVCVLIASFLLGNEIFGYQINASTAFRIAVIFIMIVLVAIFLCIIFYYIGMLKTLSVLKKAGWEGKCPRNRVSIYAAVLNIVAAVFMVIVFVSSVTDISGLTSILSAVASFGLVLYFFGAGMTMFKLKDSLTELPGIK
ncbi:MAG: hypothetical protein K6E85_15870 [Lachnospiraceae bacterium]|nr:hypothetical protein [Lachnospiraceae bacterium]